MPGLIERRFTASERLSYDPSTDTVRLISGFRGTGPIVGVRALETDADVVQAGDVLVRDSAILRGDSVFQGNILSGNVVTVDLKSGNTAILGDVGVVGASEVSGVEVGGDGGSLVVIGNILASRVSIEAPSVILGSVLASSELRITAPTAVLGRVVVGTELERGRAHVERATIFQLYAYGDVELGGGVTVISPIVVSVGGSLRLSGGDVRVLSFPCVFCPETRNPVLCEHYLRGSCPLSAKGGGFDYMAEYDLSGSGTKEYLCWYWRASPMMVFQNVLAKKLLYASQKLSKSLRVDVGRKELGGIPLSKLPAEVLTLVLKEATREARGSFEEVKQELFRTIEEYFKARGEPFIKCGSCGMPNPAEGRVCVYCGNQLERYV